MFVFTKIESFQHKMESFKEGTTIGFVPTMGALHKGHLSLVKQAKSENNFVIVSIFVNPTQFDKSEDLTNYPITVEQDITYLKAVGCDVVFVPDVDEIYKGTIKAQPFDFEGLEFKMEGKHRVGHFDGVGTIVKRLFEIVKPTSAYFGEKDFQQLLIIRKMVEKQNLPVKIIGCPIFREKDGLAMSSRNARLTKEQRKIAPFIYKILQEAKIEFETKTVEEVVSWVENEFKKQALLNLEYFEIADEDSLSGTNDVKITGNSRGFIAVFAGEIRLIDNLQF